MRTANAKTLLVQLDNYHADTGHAIESKFTHAVADRRTRRQVEKDAFLLRAGIVVRITWVLYYGGSENLLTLLRGAGIEIVEGWENLMKEEAS